MKNIKYRTFIIEYIPTIDAYKCWQDSSIPYVRKSTCFYADSIIEAKQDIDEMMDFDPSDV